MTRTTYGPLQHVDDRLLEEYNETDPLPLNKSGEEKSGFLEGLEEDL